MLLHPIPPAVLWMAPLSRTSFSVFELFAHQIPLQVTEIVPKEVTSKILVFRVTSVRNSAPSNHPTFPVPLPSPHRNTTLEKHSLDPRGALEMVMAVTMSPTLCSCH